MLRAFDIILYAENPKPETRNTPFPKPSNTKANTQGHKRLLNPKPLAVKAEP